MFSRNSNRVAVSLSVLLTAAVSVLDYQTGWTISLPLFYIIPISAATWFGGKRAGVPLCMLAALMGLIVRLGAQQSLGLAIWNAGERFGVFLAVCVLVDHLKQHNADIRIVKSLHWLLVCTAGFGLLLAGVGFVAQRHLSSHAMLPAADASIPVTPVLASTWDTSPAAGSIHALLEQVVHDTPAVMQLSRPVLLGSRDPSGPSCVSVSGNGQVTAIPNNPGDLDGGPGTKMATLYFFDRQNVTTPREDFLWHQSRLKQFLENQATGNQRAQQSAERLAERAMQLSKRLDGLTAWPASGTPDEIKPITFTDRTDWPSYCLASLADAISAKNLESARQWSAELAAATFSLADLHRWLSLLVENQLTALDFQARCETLFVSADAVLAKYDPASTVSQFPAGVLSLNGLGNYYEVERQAERIFWMPADRIEALKLNGPYNSESVWVPPTLRPYFLRLQAELSSANRVTWAQAARTPYEHSYLINMLYRATHVEAADDMAAALRRFDANYPHATVGELMSPLMYRGHSFGGLEWSDRYLPQLMSAAQQIKGDDAQAFLAATKWTNQFYRAPAVYGVTLTLRDAIEQRRLDCVRSTDMIGALYRNSGHIGFGHVRWCAESAGHSVAALLHASDGKSTVLLGDGLVGSDELESWPQAYFHGHAWPAGFEQNPTPYATELYIRGIDSYLWAEGYIVRGPNAGILQRAAIPYSIVRRTRSVEKVFDGPYPQ